MKNIFPVVLVALIIYSTLIFPFSTCFADRYDLMVSQEIDISAKGVVGSCEFKNKYKGRYMVGLLIGEKVNVRSSKFTYKPQIAMEINFYNDGILLKTLKENTLNAFYGKIGSGFILYTYRCPEELPRNKVIKCEVSITGPDTYLSENYGPITFFISKMSDK